MVLRLLLSTLTLLLLHLVAVTGDVGPGNIDGQARVRETPVLSIHRKEIVLRPGDVLTVTCKGVAPLKWTYPLIKAQNPPITTRVTVRENRTDSTKYPYESQLEVEALMYADTGYFRCAYARQSARGRTAAVYVYVYDGRHLFVPPTPDHIPGMGRPYLGLMYQGRPYGLPCRPTHPRAKVTLLKGSTALVLGDDLKYNSRDGFRILYPNPTYGTMMSCHFTFNGTKEELSVLLSYRASTAVPQPELDASHTNVLVGENMTFRCYLRVTPGTIVHIKWSYSSNEHSDRIRISDTTKESLVANGYHYDEVQSKLTVRNVYPEDGGVYRCTVTTHDQKTNQRETLVNVHERTFVYLTSTKEIEVKVGTPAVSLSMSIYAYPPSHVVWYRHGKPILPTDRHYETRVRSDRAKLKIYTPSRADAGEYVLHAFTRDMNTSEKVILLVNEPPRVAIASPGASDFYHVGRRYNLTCTFSGFPVPSARWSWQPCHHMGCVPSESSWEAVIASRNIPMVSRNEIKSTLTLLAREAGFYRCAASNKVGDDHQVVPFYATDVAHGFPKKARSLTPIEGEVMTMSCQANRLTFHPPRLYVLRDGQPIVLSNQTGLTLTLSGTNYSHVLTLTIAAVQLSDSGTYYCQTEDAEGARHRADTLVDVRPMVAPTFTRHLDGTYYLEPGVKYTLECDAVGVPTPSVSWFKDGQPLTPGSEHHHLSLNSNQTRLTFSPIDIDDTAVYSCEASNGAGLIGSNLTLNVQGAPPTSGKVTQGQLTKEHIGIIAGCSVAILLVICLAMLLVRRLHRPHYYPDECLLATKGYINPDLPIDEQTDAIAYDIKWEFPRERLTFGMLLGQGAFGKVVKAEAVGICGTPGNTPVAVKMPKDYSDPDQMKALLSELKVLIHIGQHLNIVNLLGACTRDMRKGVLYVIVEYCPYGNLREYLLKKRTNFVDTMGDLEMRLSPSSSVDTSRRDMFLPDRDYVNTLRMDDCNVCPATDDAPLTTKRLVCFAFQIARGMDYLASRKYLHRDLAARNILLADDGIVKIADFGLAKDCYKYDAYQKKTDGKVPVKWHAIESLTHKIYTTKSDVWSYGVLLWELFTVGGNPYPAIDIDETFVDRLKNGYRLERPAYATEQIYGTMMQCWAADPDDRPDFAELGNRFGNLLQASVKQHYIALESQYLMVKDGTNSEYLRMAGGVMTYIPMSSDADTSAMASVPADPDDDDVIVDDNDIGEDGDVGVGHDYYANRQYQRPPSSPTHVELQPITTLGPNDVTHDVTPTADDRRLHHTDDDDATVPAATDDTPGDCPGQTKVLIHSQPKQHQNSCQTDSYYDFTTSQQAPFLQRSGSDRSENEAVPRAGRKGYKCNDSVTSDTSSGFHSDFFPDEPVSPDHTQFVFPNGGVLKEVMV